MTDPGERPTADELDQLIDAGLYEPGAPGAVGRLELLRHLLEKGATVDDMLAARAERRLHAAAGDRILRRGGDRITLAELAERSGVSESRIRSIWRASGFTEPPPESELWVSADAETFRLFQTGAEFLGDDILAQFTRVVGTSMSRIADAAVALFLANIELPIITTESRPVELAEAVTEGMQLLDELPVVFDSLFRHHVEVAIRRAVGAWEQVTPTAVHCIGFVDLVGSSQLVNRLEAGHLSRVMTEFERAASDLVTGRGNRVVKAIGDEVMYYTVEPAAACEIALDLIDAVEAHDVLGTARAGINVGPVVWQDGDCYGPVVSLAARLVDEAEPGEVLVGSGVADALAGHDGLVAATAGRRRVKGFDDPVPIHRVSRRS